MSFKITDDDSFIVEREIKPFNSVCGTHTPRPPPSSPLPPYAPRSYCPGDLYARRSITQKRADRRAVDKQSVRPGRCRDRRVDVVVGIFIDFIFFIFMINSHVLSRREKCRSPAIYRFTEIETSES